MGFWFTLGLWTSGIAAVGMLILFLLYSNSSREKKRNLTSFLAIVTSLLLGLFAQLVLVTTSVPF